ncbi:MAG: ATPase [Frankiales bacterium]|nr:ATPase [Frankiales bacterium]
MTTTHQPSQQDAVRLTRTILASPARVYRAWLDPDLIRRWFSPSDFTVSDAIVDERVGGRHSVWHRNADGDLGGFESRLLELVPDERIVFAWGFVGPDRVADPTHESRLTIQLRPDGNGGTELTLVHERLAGLRASWPAVAAGVSDGWTQALTKLAKLVQAVSS